MASHLGDATTGAFILIAPSVPQAKAADTTENFYQGRMVKVLIGFPAGGG
jgi:hypothetical protein